MSRKSLVTTGICLLILILQNIFIFWGHYFADQVFPWDFLATYHAVPFYWMKLLSNGLNPDWIPFQGLGYPLYLNLQSSYYYPVLQLLAFAKVEYSLHVAVIVQCLHVLFGSIGAYVCVRSMGMGWPSALLAGVMYQGFGGFYSNSEHVDIVRVYALLPWIFAPIFSIWGNRYLGHKFTVITYPLLVAMLITGGYMGGVVAVLFLANIVLGLKIIFSRNYKMQGILIGFLLFLGIALSAIYWLPVFLNMDVIARVGKAASFNKDYIELLDIFTLSFSSERDIFKHDISMRSIFIGIPAIALIVISLTSRIHLNPWVLLTAILSILLGGGALLGLLAGYFPLLSFSRFVIADYKGIFALSMILLAVQSFNHLSLSFKSGVFSILIMSIWILLGTYYLGFDAPKDNRETIGIVLVTVLTFGLLGLRQRYSKTIFFVILLMLVIIDWYRINNDKYFYSATMNPVSFQLGIKKNNEPYGVLGGFMGNVGCRGARIDIAGGDHEKKPWRGYYTGEYMMEDYGGATQFWRTQKILKDPDLHRFAAQSWHAIEMDDSQKNQLQNLVNHSSSTRIQCLSYKEGIQTFDVKTEIPITIIENEPYYKGWSASLKDENGKEFGRINPQDFEGFRMWRLPAGSFRVEPRFAAPGKTLGLWVTIFAGLLYFLTIAAYILYLLKLRKVS